MAHQYRTSRKSRARGACTFPQRTPPSHSLPASCIGKGVQSSSATITCPAEGGYPCRSTIDAPPASPIRPRLTVGPPDIVFNTKEPIKKGKRGNIKQKGSYCALLVVFDTKSPYKVERQNTKKNEKGERHQTAKFATVNLNRTIHSISRSHQL